MNITISLTCTKCNHTWEVVAPEGGNIDVACPRCNEQKDGNI